MKLVPIQRNGSIAEPVGAMPVVASTMLVETSKLYESAGFVPPWICYIGVANGTVVGTCGFKAPPREGSVEIAYFTFPGYEGKGVATQMARQLLSIARNADPGVRVTAQTMPTRNASHRVLEKLGFSCMGPVQHPEDGTVLAWRVE